MAPSVTNVPLFVNVFPVIFILFSFCFNIFFFLSTYKPTYSKNLSGNMYKYKEDLTHPALPTVESEPCAAVFQGHL